MTLVCPECKRVSEMDVIAPFLVNIACTCFPDDWERVMFDRQECMRTSHDNIKRHIF